MEKQTGKILAITGGVLALGTVLYFVLRPKTAVARTQGGVGTGTGTGMGVRTQTDPLADIKKAIEDLKRRQSGGGSGGGTSGGGSRGGGSSSGGGRPDYSVYDNYDYDYDYDNNYDYNYGYGYEDLGAYDYVDYSYGNGGNDYAYDYGGGDGRYPQYGGYYYGYY